MLLSQEPHELLEKNNLGRPVATLGVRLPGKNSLSHPVATPGARLVESRNITTSQALLPEEKANITSTEVLRLIERTDMAGLTMIHGMSAAQAPVTRRSGKALPVINHVTGQTRKSRLL